MTEDIEQQAQEALWLDATATPGEWAEDDAVNGGIHSVATGKMLIPYSVVPTLSTEDRAFVAESRTLLPALARAVLEHREVLRAVEWVSSVQHESGVWFPACPVCGGAKGAGHVPDCTLARVLGKGESNG